MHDALTATTEDQTMVAVIMAVTAAQRESNSSLIVKTVKVDRLAAVVVAGIDRT